MWGWSGDARSWLDLLPKRFVTASFRRQTAEAVTLYSGRWRGARANAGRLGYPNHSEIIERNDDGLITAARLFRAYEAPYGRVEVLDRSGHKAWSNPLWTA